ncbi:eukaryotic translation initiation factor 3 subunit E [Entomophthora muscae]|uniref:Eukaryotic translation initiation factor 3 subunit E n=2 Tax=Entomophthora muscae TaxID=34485 RepID=A0ACC2SI90_9FUNG|nr:eukaryotic translation initiation factor 3 subunit E [Entomophthora muscae]
MAHHDLTSKMIPYLDRHLSFPLLEYLGLKEIYDVKDILQAKYDLMSKTNMVDFAITLYQELHKVEEVPADLSKRREEILATLNSYTEQAAKVMEVIENPKVIGALRQDKEQNIKLLQENFDVDSQAIYTLYQIGQYQYTLGNYGACIDMLYHYQILSLDERLVLSSIWGKLASEILSGNWENAYTDLQKLKEATENGRQTSAIQLLHQRTHLIHWSLFIFFNHQNGKDYLLDMLFQPQYINTIQTSCPWILRYVAAAAVISRRRKNVLKDLIKVIQEESHAYEDPITQFVKALYVDIDFDGAQAKLKECEDVISNDFFLTASSDDFFESARILILEAYCRTNQRINISLLSERLNLSPEEGEKWIVNLIRDTRVDAKIDFTDNSVVMNPINTSIYRQMIEKTRDVVFQSRMMINGIEKRDNALAAAKDNKKSGNNRRQNTSAAH